MTQTYHAGIHGRITDTPDIQSGFSKAQDGIESALTHYYGDADPSAAATPPWDGNQYGTVWVDANDPDNPITKRWEKLDGTPTPWGWRTLSAPLVHHLDEADWFDLPSNGVEVADTGWHPAGESLSVLLDAVQAVPIRRVTAVLVKLTVTAGGDIVGANAYIAFRKLGSAGEGIRHFAQVKARPTTEAMFWLQLDAAEKYDWQAFVGDTTPSFNHTGKVVAYATDH